MFKDIKETPSGWCRVCEGADGNVAVAASGDGPDNEYIEQHGSQGPWHGHLDE
jgi:hypothetical protein